MFIIQYNNWLEKIRGKIIVTDKRCTTCAWKITPKLWSGKEEVSTIRIKVIYQKTKIILICLWYRTAYTTVKTDNVGRFNYCKGEIYIFAFFIYSDKVYVKELLLTVLALNRFDELFWKYMISIFVVIIMFALEN